MNRRAIGFVGLRTALEADGLEILTEVERTGTASWCHFRAADTVLEIIGPGGSV